MIEVRKKETQTTGIATGVFVYGYGYLREKVTVKSNKWQVLRNGTKLCECQSKKQAEEIATAMRNWHGE